MYLRLASLSRVVDNISSKSNDLARFLFRMRDFSLLRVWISSPVSRTMEVSLIFCIYLTLMKARLFSSMSVFLILKAKNTWFESMA